ncbi:unnamed protein product, partial [Mesorhabditis spiculigera]
MNSEEPTHSIMVDFSTILVLGVEGVGLVLYAIIMWILGAARSNSLRTQFYTQSWILESFHVSLSLALGGGVDFFGILAIGLSTGFNRTGTVGILLFPCLFCAILNIGCFWKLQHNTRSIMSNSQKRRNLRMLIYAGLVIIAAFPITAYQSLKFYGTMVGAKQFTADVTQFFDLCYLPFLFGSPVILLAMSVEVRKEFLNVITCRWRSTAGDLSDKGEITAVQGVLTQFSMPPKLSVNSIVPLRI